jgi:hypothetical protein
VHDNAALQQHFVRYQETRRLVGTSDPAEIQVLSISPQRQAVAFNNTEYVSNSIQRYSSW